MRKRTLLTMAALSLSLASCGGWSRRDTTLELGVLALEAQDWRQTDAIVAHGAELNPMAAIAPDVYCPLSMLTHVAISALLPRGRWRTAWQAASIGVESWVVYRNHEMGW